MSRMKYIRFLSKYPVLLIMLAVLLVACNTRKEPMPNVILILADDLGYGDVEFLNPDSRIPTPNLNRMAEEGIAFTNGHAPASVCTPTRYAILTGEYPWRSSLKQGVLWIWDPPLIRSNAFTLPKMMREQGYHTACIGKWHLGWHWPTTDGRRASLKNQGRNVDYTQPIGGGPLEAGFDYYFGDDVPGFPPHAFIENDRVVEIPSDWQDGGPGAPGAKAPGWRYEDLLPTLSTKAVSYLEKKAKEEKRQPFFLFLSLNAPHTPIAPAEAFTGKTTAGPYGDFVYQVDHTLGEVLEALKDYGMVRNTLVIFSSDNGAVPFDGTNYTGAFGSIYTYGHDPNAPLRGVKSDAWEGGHREPFIAYWPGTITAGRSDAPVSLTDMVATLADLTGYELPDTVAADSYSFLPLLKGESDRSRASLVTQSGNGILSIQRGEWKLIMSSGSGGSWSEPKGELPYPESVNGILALKNVQLYNLESDISESNNLADQHPEIIMELAELLARQILQGRSTEGSALRNDGPGTWKQVEWVSAMNINENDE